MEIKEISDNKILHLIKYGTRYSIRTRIPNKESSNIIKY